MEHAVQRITQSKYFMPTFNAAIYDGPVRIYFSQVQEPEALKIYSYLQRKIIKLNHSVCTTLRQKGRTIFVLLYPSEDSFERSFDEAFASDSAEGPHVACENLGQDFVVGVPAPLREQDFENIWERLRSSLYQSDNSLMFV